jgi:anti-anti-sigma factor
VVVVRGEVDAAAVLAFSTCVERALASQLPLVIDVGGVRFMDSSGLAVIVAAHNRLTREQRGQVVVRNPPEHLRRLVHASGLHGLLVLD